MDHLQLYRASVMAEARERAEKSARSLGQGIIPVAVIAQGLGEPWAEALLGPDAAQVDLFDLPELSVSDIYVRTLTDAALRRVGRPSWGLVPQLNFAPSGNWSWKSRSEYRDEMFGVYNYPDGSGWYAYLRAGSVQVIFEQGQDAKFSVLHLVVQASDFARLHPFVQQFEAQLGFHGAVAQLRETRERYAAPSLV